MGKEVLYDLVEEISECVSRVSWLVDVEKDGVQALRRMEDSFCMNFKRGGGRKGMLSNFGLAFRDYARSRTGRRRRRNE